MTDELSVTGIECWGYHGVFEHERREGQTFVVDLTLGLDTAPAAASDDLRDTVDYGSLVAAVKQAVEADPVDLIETLAQRLADVCLRDGRVEWVRITVHKPDAPIEATFGDVTLTITRTAPQQQPEADQTSPPEGEATMTETPNPHIVDSDTLTGEMRPIRRAVLSLGSNLGERLTSLQGAVHALADTPDVWVTNVSPVYETEPVDCPPGSEDFLNAVVLIDTTLAASRLLDRAHAIEDAFGRERGDGIEVNAPRTLDVDVIVVGDRRADDDSLRLPHPRAHERAFVLQPWYDVEPDAVLPDHGPIVELLEHTDRSGLKLREDATLAGPVTDASRAATGMIDPPPDEEPDDTARRRGPAPADLAEGADRLGPGRAGRRLAVPCLRRPADDRRARRDLGPAARAVPGRRDPRRHGAGHLADHAGPPAVAGSAPGRQPAGAGAGVRLRRRPGRRRLPRLRAELGRGARPSWPSSAPSARSSPASAAPAWWSPRCCSSERVASGKARTTPSLASCLPPRLVVGSAVPASPSLSPLSSSRRPPSSAPSWLARGVSSRPPPSSASRSARSPSGSPTPS